MKDCYTLDFILGIYVRGFIDNGVSGWMLGARVLALEGRWGG